MIITGFVSIFMCHYVFSNVDMVTIAAIDLLPHTSSLFIALSENTYFMLFIIVLSFIGQYIEDVIKRIKFSKKVSHRVENLKIEVLLLFFESSFWNNQ